MYTSTEVQQHYTQVTGVTLKDWGAYFDNMDKELASIGKPLSTDERFPMFDLDMPQAGVRA
jgi:hypothetical protein